MKNRSHGFTLIELMTAILVVAILLGIAVPSFRQFAADSRTQAASSDLTTALSYARSEALRRSSRVVTCASANGSTCSGEKDWTTGWVVFADTNTNGNVDADELLHTWPALQGNVTAGATSARAVYTPIGMALLPVGDNAVTFTLTPASCSGNRIRQSVLSLSGSVQSKKIACP